MFFSDSQVSRHDVQLAGTKVNDASMWSNEQWKRWSTGFLYPEAVANTDGVAANQLVADAPKLGLKENSQIDKKSTKTLADQKHNRAITQDAVINQHGYEKDLTTQAYELTNQIYEHDRFINSYNKPFAGRLH